jgi:hypothetical protein
MKLSSCLMILAAASWLHAAEPVDFTVKLETVMKHDDGKFLWFHPRAAAVPGGVVMTIQKHLKVSDYYSGLHFMRRDGVDGAWSGPTAAAGDRLAAAGRGRDAQRGRCDAGLA